MARGKPRRRGTVRGGAPTGGFGRLLAATQTLAMPGMGGVVTTPRLSTTAAASPFARGVTSLGGIDLNTLLSRGAAGAASLIASPTGWMVGFGGQIKLLLEMLSDWWHGGFEVPRGTLAALVAALVYFASPIDVVPEIVPVAGYIDDALVVMACIRLMQADLRRYARFRRIDLVALGL